MVKALLVLPVTVKLPRGSVARFYSRCYSRGHVNRKGRARHQPGEN